MGFHVIWIVFACLLSISLYNIWMCYYIIVSVSIKYIIYSSLLCIVGFDVLWWTGEIMSFSKSSI